MNCHCGIKADVKYTTPEIGGKPSEVHNLCIQHMREIWSEICQKFSGTKMHEASSFEPIAQEKVA